MSKFGFISGIESHDGQKKKYQVFEATVGFETATLVVPFENAEAFSSEAYAKKPRTLTMLNKLANSYGGYVE